jgi:hypothetical protein
MAIGGSAMLVSIVSLVLAIEHGRTMERMAEANTRMVEASSWPFITFATHNVDLKGEPNINFVLTNEGVGPARVESLELWLDGKPIASPTELMKACCQTTPTEIAQLPTTPLTIGIAAPRILRAGDHNEFFLMHRTPENTELWSRFNSARLKMTARVCYCSVFDECWVSSGRTTHAEHVDSCPKPDTPYLLSVQSRE